MTEPLKTTSAIQYAVGNPARSAWVSANAGTGKTYVLVRRVIRQLLAGAEPGSIVCITFTKAGAAEMADRLMTMLGDWALMEDAPLAEAIAEVTGETPPRDRLGDARRLFARALESPGGLKVQTIHSFCTSLLSRFPAEAGLPLGLRGIEDDEAQKLLGKAIRRLAMDAADPGHVLHEDVLGITEVLSSSTEEGLNRGVTLDEALRDYARLTRSFAGLPEDAEEVLDAIKSVCGAPDRSEAELIQECWDRRDQEFMSTVASTFESLAGGNAKKLASAFRTATEEGPEKFVGGDVLYTKDGGVRSFKVKKEDAVLVPDFSEKYSAFKAYLEDCREAIRKRRLYERNVQFYWIARYVLSTYAVIKRAELALDYDDLIERTLGLLTNVNTAWVQYKLDQGMDHILLDEAQDTSDVQWKLFEQLVSEMASQDSEAAGSDRQRSFFVVGDPKQSIYAFQGADASLFRSKREQYKAQLSERLEDGRLFLSFRTAEAVLRVVDAMFDQDAFRTFSGGYDPHASAHPERPGSVELWPHWPVPEKEEIDQWQRPVDALSDQSVDRRLAKEIATHIRRRIEGGERLACRKGRLATASDVMVLFQRRGPRFNEVIKALQEEGIPCAGTDRIRVRDDTAVRDLLALLRFTANRDDSLSLAVLLKSPLLGWTDDDLMEICTERQQHLLWAELQRRGREGHARSAQAASELRSLADEGARHGPYRLLSAFLDGGGALTGHARNHTRLGQAYREAVESFLDEAMRFEDTNPRSVHGFLIHAEKITRDIKRETAGDEVTGVRVMTVHGAKGLEAPIVYCADADYFKAAQHHHQREVLVSADLGDWALPILVKGKKQDLPGSITALRQDAEDRRHEEYQRLFYVAATRAEEHLVICGGKAPKTENGPPTWHELATRGFRALQDEVEVSKLDASWGGTILRYADEKQVVIEPATSTKRPSVEATPAWINEIPPREEASPIIFPSLLVAPEDEARGALSPVSSSGDQARVRGLLVHSLLEVLPEYPASERSAVALRVAAASDLSPEGQEEAVRDAAALLDDPALAPLFGPGSRAEVSIQGQLDGKTFSGKIDRLLIDGDRILAAEYKSTRWIPNSAADIPLSHLRQLQTYLRLLRLMKPAATVEGLMIYTAGPVTFPIA